MGQSQPLCVVELFFLLDKQLSDDPKRYGAKKCRCLVIDILVSVVVVRG